MENPIPISRNEPLSKYSTFQVGGTADYFCQIDKKEDIKGILEFFREANTPIYVIGAGSNILFSDEGFHGAIIKLNCKNIQIEGENLIADAGVSIPTLIKFSTDHQLTGLERWAGLPGTVGGAVRGNAGCHGLETKDILLKATVLDPETGEKTDFTPEELQYSYRHSLLKEKPAIVLDATFKLTKSSQRPEELQKTVQTYRKQRIEKQPFGATTGSFFKNPSPDQPAGLLIEKAGLKGKTIGKAQISEKHGNFFLNLGGATAKDITDLATLAKTEVKKQFNIDLEEEVVILPSTLA